MPKLTPEQRAQLEAQLAADDDDEDDGDDEVSWYQRDKDGSERGATMKARRARDAAPGWLKELFAPVADALTGDGGDDGGKDGGGKAGKGAAGKDATATRRFAGGRRVG